MNKFLTYLKFRPLSLRDWIMLYSTYLHITFYKYARGKPWYNMENEFSEIIKIKYDGLIFNLRKKNLLPDINFSTMNVVDSDKVRSLFNFRGVFVDVGAYIGSYTLRAARRCEKVYSFEPNPYSFRLLEMNVRDNNFSNVELYNLALGSDFGEARLKISLAGSSISDEGEYKVKVIPLDSLRLKRVDLMKVDVEGYEVNVLKGPESTLDVTDEVIIEVWEKNMKEVEEIMRQHGFRVLDKDLTYPQDTVWYFRYVKRK